MKSKIFLIVLTIVSMCLIGVKLKNIAKAEMIVNKCFLMPTEFVIFRVTGYKQGVFELSGIYKTEGVFFIIPFVNEVPQKNLELGIEKGYVEELDCQEIMGND